MVRTLIVLALIPTAALAQTIEQPTIQNGVVRFVVRSELPIGLYMTELVNRNGWPFPRDAGPGQSADVRGITTTVPEGCQRATPVNGPVTIPFAGATDPSYTLHMILTVVDPSAPDGCRPIERTFEVH